MPAYIKLGGVWNEAARVYRKMENGVWTATDLVYVKYGGVWTLAHEYDIVPPPAPEISLRIVDTEFWEDEKQKTGRYIRVGVRLPGGAHDIDLRRIRVLTTYQGKSPTTQYGGNYIANPDNNYPDEPWSDFSFNGYNDSPTSKSSSDWVYKEFPRNATKQTNMAAGKQWFGVWSEDLNGNWSVGTFTNIQVPKKGVDAANKRVKEARFQTTAIGSWTNERFVYGRARQADKPRSRGMFFYGNQLKSQIGSQGTPSVKKAQILLQRTNDGGKDMANIYIGRHMYSSPGGIGQGPDINEVRVLGQLGKGQSKWFDLPNAYLERLEKDDMKGVGFWYKNPSNAHAHAQDFSELIGRADNVRAGELHVVWEETY